MTDSQHKVSVIIPAYNCALYIADSINSITSQTYKNLECIVIDDCSTDNTWEIIQSLSRADARIKPHRNLQNVGIGANRRHGIELAVGEYICWQDADDISLPGRVERQVDFLRNHPEVGAVGGFLEFFGDKTPSSIRKYAADDEKLRKDIFKYNPVAQPAAMVRRECYETIGSYDESYTVSEDLEMLFRIGTKYKFGNIQEVAIRYRQHASSLTVSKLRHMELTTLKLRWRYARHSSYKPDIVDFVYNVAQFISIFLIPSRLKMAIFNKLRNS